MNDSKGSNRPPVHWDRKKNARAACGAPSGSTTTSGREVTCGSCQNHYNANKKRRSA